VTLLAYSRPFWPLFLHVLGAMLLFGFVLTALVTALAGKARPTMTSLQLSIAAYAVMRGAAAWIYSKEGWSGHGDPTWLTLGMNIADGGLLVLLLAFTASFWWVRSGKPRAQRLAIGFTGIYIVLLAVAWLAMSGKWG
jgi:hypothetical protein